MNFKELEIRQELQKAVEDMGYEKPSEIQERAIPLLLAGNDVIGQSQTGTGKTAAFMLWILEKVSTTDYSNTKALIVCPTRELAMQVASEGKKFAKYLDGINIVPVYGGEGIDRQIKELKKGKDIIVGTPGRIMDHIRRKTIRLQQCDLLVLDEADEMLNMGFHDDIVELISHLPEKRQTALFSATMPKPILKLTNDILTNPEHVQIKRESMTVSSIKQCSYEVYQTDKLKLLVQLLRINKPQSAMIFCNTKKQVDELTSELNAANITAMGLHGDMKQEMRTAIMKRFKDKRSTILVATDVAARGIDVDNIEIVFNYDIPQELEYYVHRIGRTGRAGNDGVAITFYNPKQHRMLKDVERIAKCTIERLELPTTEDLDSIIYDELELTVNKWATGSSNNDVLAKMNGIGYMDKTILEALLNKFISEHSFSVVSKPERRTSSSKSNKSDRNGKSGRSDKSGKREKSKKIVIGIGKKHEVSASHIISAIANATSLQGRDFGKITIDSRTSVVEIPESKVDEVIKAMAKETIKGKSVFVNVIDK